MVDGFNLASKYNTLLLLIFMLVSCSALDTFMDSEQPIKIDPSQDPSRPHPKKATSWHTQSLILQTEQPDFTEVNLCKEKITEISNTALNEQNLVNSIGILIESTREKPIIYHWCFYHMMREIDLSLEDDGISITKKSSFFYDEMKKLWILSRALYEITEDISYYDFLRKRYFDISQVFFGLQIELYGRSLDEILPQAPSAPPKQSPTELPSQGE